MKFCTNVGHKKKQTFISTLAQVTLVIFAIVIQRWQERFKNGTSWIQLTNETNPRPPHELDIIRGSAYGIFSRKFVEFVLTDQRAKDLLQWSQNTYSPDEHYWATLHHTLYNPQLNTPGAYSGSPRFTVAFILSLFFVDSVSTSQA